MAVTEEHLFCDKQITINNIAYKKDEPNKNSMCASTGSMTINVEDPPSWVGEQIFM